MVTSIVTSIVTQLIVHLMVFKSHNRSYYLSAVACASTYKTLLDHLAERVKEILTLLSGGVVPIDQVLDDRQVGKFNAPSAPLTQSAEGPTTVG